MTFMDDAHMLVRYNRGARIVLGMPSCLFDGNDRQMQKCST